jgi:hypothetical protein
MARTVRRRWRGSTAAVATATAAAASWSLAWDGDPCSGQKARRVGVTRVDTEQYIITTCYSRRRCRRRRRRPQRRRLMIASKAGEPWRWGSGGSSTWSMWRHYQVAVSAFNWATYYRPCLTRQNHAPLMSLVSNPQSICNKAKNSHIFAAKACSRLSLSVHRMMKETTWTRDSRQVTVATACVSVSGDRRLTGQMPRSITGSSTTMWLHYATNQQQSAPTREIKSWNGHY